MTLLNAWATAGFVILGLVSAVWLLSLALRDSSIVDIFWGAGFIAVIWTLVMSAGDAGPRGWLMAALVTVWGMRLSLHILLRNRGRGEDFRYRTWREEAGAAWWWRSYFKVFLLQGAEMWIVALPLAAVASTTATGALSFSSARPGASPGLGWFEALGVVVWSVGLLFEAIGDRQLMRFKADPANKGRVMSSGLWRYTRHPNYFGDATVWWGHYLVAAAAGAWWTIVSPALMTFLLVRVSGVSMLERTLSGTKPGYREYIESTSAFVPLPPGRRP